MQLNNHISLILLPPTLLERGDSADSNYILSAQLDNADCDGLNVIVLNTPSHFCLNDLRRISKANPPITMSQLALSLFS